MKQAASGQWDVFCKIVDNHGDIGVCWRLSRQLASEHGLRVRLFIDDLMAAKSIIPQLDPKLPQQELIGVSVCAWPDATTVPAKTVLETFSCGLPMAFLEKMVAQQAHWINLDYLSAEDWVASFHGKPSPHPQLPITKHFFFPGFELNTGGLLREQALIQQRADFIEDSQAQRQFWQALGYEQGVIDLPGSLKLSLFCYPQANINGLLDGLLSYRQAITVFFPASPLHRPDSLFADFEKTTERSFKKHHVTVQLLPFLSQANYDRLLWSCDLNFVRGEDSWLRAIWAGQPFIWQPYLQDEGTHLIKMQAFLTRYTAHAPIELAKQIEAAHYAWSDAKSQANPVFSELLLATVQHKAYAKQAAERLANAPDLASKLLRFNEKLMENKV